jgi:hypothetical protein
MRKTLNTSLVFRFRNALLSLLLPAVFPADGAAQEQPGSATSALTNKEEIPLEAGFTNPPPVARPWVYWFWMNGNVTPEGITADLEAMAEAGLGGVILMSVSNSIPPGPAKFFSPEWRRLFQHAVSEAARLGLEVNMTNADSWTGSAGPWITPDLSMQKLTWSSLDVSGPGSADLRLPDPPRHEGF